MKKLFPLLFLLSACGGNVSVGTDDAGTTPIYPLRAICHTEFAGVRWEATDFELLKVTLPDGTSCDSETVATEHPCPGCTTLQCAGKGYGVRWGGGPSIDVLVTGDRHLDVGVDILAVGEPMCY
jgi:hypothetical protein